MILEGNPEVNQTSISSLGIADNTVRLPLVSVDALSERIEIC
jgi:hypothetical protein